MKRGDRPRLTLVPPPRRVGSEILEVGDLRLDVTRRRARRGWEVLDLTPIELGILEDLMRHAGQVRSLEQIAEFLQKTSVEPQRQAPLKPSRLPPHVSRLRAKMDQKWPVKLLRTVRGAGYVLHPAESGGSPIVPIDFRF